MDEIFVATGRRPDTGTLELEAGGIETTGGAVAVDDTLRSSVRGVWAAGDVAGGPQFTHVADYQAKLVLRNAIFPLSSRADYSTVPAVTFIEGRLFDRSGRDLYRSGSGAGRAHRSRSA